MSKSASLVVAGSLRVAIVYSVGLHELPPYLKEYMRSYPQVNVHVEYARPNKIYDSVIAGQIDLGIVLDPREVRIEPPLFVQRAFTAEPKASVPDAIRVEAESPGSGEGD